MVTHEAEVAARAKRVVRLRDGLMEGETVNVVDQALVETLGPADV
jgi:hypothetical protein